MERVLPDANVLYPISVADLTLRLGDVRVHDVLWTDDLLDEVHRVLVERKNLTPAQANYFCSCIRDAFPEGEIQRAAYADLVASRTGKDPDDHVHAAAAVGGGATVLITSNTCDYPAEDLGAVRLLTPDTYFSEVLADFPAETMAVLVDMGRQRREPQPLAATLEALHRAGLTTFVSTAKALAHRDVQR